MSEINPPANNTPAEIRGSCLCGQVLVTVTGAPVASAVCHCLHCQKTAGSAFSTVLLLPDEAVSVEGACGAITMLPTAARASRGLSAAGAGRPSKPRRQAPRRRNYA